MKQGTIYRSSDNASYYPYFIIAQTDQLREFATRVIIPLARRSQGIQPISKVNPVVNIAGEEFILLAHILQTVFCDELDDENIVARRTDLRDVIVDAVDFATTGSQR
ncbi:CcdB family protein [Brenneria populi subsp. brevivirga]|uniref:CcdB family protein n=1 Tax=Brenneria populi TaxID=1505588 RepID=UPI002E1890F5|nr:CcdB family protein [Brenneria populi subsp. brevivirga]